MLKLPKEHLSVSQINLWESDPIAYQKKYFIGIPDLPSPFLEFGKTICKRHRGLCGRCAKRL
jgi:hypothetical protein